MTVEDLISSRAQLSFDKSGSVRFPFYLCSFHLPARDRGVEKRDKKRADANRSSSSSSSSSASVRVASLNWQISSRSRQFTFENCGSTVGRARCAWVGGNSIEKNDFSSVGRPVARTECKPDGFRFLSSTSFTFAASWAKNSR